MYVAGLSMMVQVRRTLQPGDSNTPPYRTGLEAMQDGWRVIQFPQLIPPYPGMEYTTSYFKFEYVFEKMVEV